MLYKVGSGTTLIYDSRPASASLKTLTAGSHFSITDDGAGNLTLAPSGLGTGTVSTVSVVTANGFAGTVANATTTPAITLTTSITGVLKGNGTAISAAAAGTDYQTPLTFSTGLTNTTGTVTVNTSQNIATLSNLTTNGFVKTSGGTGALSVDTTAYVPTTTTVNGHALSSNVTVTTTDLSLNNLTNDAQTKAAIVPNTAPSSGQILVGNAGGTAYAPQTVSGAFTLASTGAATIATPGTLTVSSSNSTATAHTHAITSSSAPGAAASILATDSSGIIGSTGTRIVKGWFTDLTVTNSIAGSITGNAATVSNATLTTALTVNTGTLTLTANSANTSVLTIGAGAVSVSGSNTGDQTNISGNAATVTTNANMTGDVTSSGSNATTVAKVGGIAVQSYVSAQGSGFVNKFRNPGMTIAQRGTSISSVSNAYTLDGWVVIATGANVAVAQAAAVGVTNFISPGALQVTGATSNTDVTIKQRIEGQDAAPLQGKTLTFQCLFYNAAGGATITPTLTVKYANSTDNWSSTTTQVSAVSLQSVANGAAGVLSYTFTDIGAASFGLEFSVDFGALNSNTKNFQVTGFDIRVTSGVSVGLNSNPPIPEFRPSAVEMAYCQRYYRKSFPQGTAPGQNKGIAGAVCIKNPIALGDPAEWIPFMPAMRTTPSVTTYNPSAANANWRNVTQSSDVTVSVDPASALSDSGVLLATSGTVATLGDILAIHYTASAEL